MGTSIDHLHSIEALLRILFVSNLYPPHHMGGYGLFCQQTADGLRKRGHDVVVLTSTHESGRGSISQITPVLRELQFDPTLSSVQAAEENSRIIKRVLSRVSVDVVLIWNTFGLGHAAVFSSIVDRPRAAYLMLHDLAHHGPGNLVNVRLLTASQIVRFHFLARGFPAHSVRLVYPGIATPTSWSPSPHNDDTVRLLFCGRIVEYKGLHIALQALESLPDHFRLTVYGRADADSQDYERALEVWVHDHGLDRRVEFRGWADRAHILQQYPLHDVLVFPSLWEEPFGLSILEALAHGLPVVASRSGGPAEIISDGKSGFLFSPGNPTEMASRLRIFGDPARKKNMGEHAWHDVSTRFAQSRFLKELEQELAAIV